MSKELLVSGGYTCVLCKGDVVYTSRFRGVKPLVKWYAEGTDVAGFSAADKVVGKATAFMYVLLQVRSVYAGVLSVPAKKVLEASGIAVEYGTLVPQIINHNKDGFCPFEIAVFPTDDPHTAYEIIRHKMEEMGITL